MSGRRTGSSAGTRGSPGKQGIVGLSGAAEYGGGGLTDFRFRNVIIEEFAKAGANSLSSSFSLQDDISIP